ncbi:MAG: hypothetical protein HYV90_05065 [Candidatus Woesebacteria bacterium]|nr:MAG: hypothetical protein HYV90_05065 [Candidatus Woesebacteria bacterium]
MERSKLNLEWWERRDGLVKRLVESGGVLVSSGRESEVVHIGDEVHQIFPPNEFDPRYNLSVFNLYKDWVDRLALKWFGQSAKLRGGGKEISFAVNIVRVLKVGVKEGFPELVRPFIEGYSLTGDGNEYFVHDHPSLGSLSSREYNANIRTVTELSSKLRESTGEQNIEVAPLNLKLNKSGAFVTDLIPSMGGFAERVVGKFK